MLMILLGTALRAARFLPESCFNGLNKLAFWVGLPCMLYLDITGARPPVWNPCASRRRFSVVR